MSVLAPAPLLVYVHLSCLALVCMSMSDLSKIMVTPAAPGEQADIKVGDVVLEKVSDFTYQGAHT